MRRPGRFDREIEIKVPDKKGRQEILQIHTRNMPLADEEQPLPVKIEKIASVSHGYVGADLEYLCKEAAMKCLRRLLPELNLEEEKIPPETLDKLIVNADDFKKALVEVTPSGMREVFIENPDVSWDKVGGLAEVKKELTGMILASSSLGMAFQLLILAVLELLINLVLGLTITSMLTV